MTQIENEFAELDKEVVALAVQLAKLVSENRGDAQEALEMFTQEFRIALYKSASGEPGLRRGK